jgi:hypothetical protein
MNNFQIDMAFKNNKNDVLHKKVAFTSKVTKNSPLMDFMIHGVLAFYRFYVLDNGPLYCITLC